MQPAQQFQPTGATLGLHISLGRGRKLSGRLRSSTKDFREEVRQVAHFHGIPLGRLGFEPEEETSRQESPQLGRNAGKGRLIRSWPLRSDLEGEITAHIKKRLVTGKGSKRLFRNDMSQRCHSFTDLLVIVLVGQIRSFTQLGGLGHKALDDLHLEKLAASIANVSRSLSKDRVESKVGRVGDGNLKQSG